MIIGLTGKYCAGKNYVATILEARGLPVLDVDKLGYQALESEKEKIFTLFGYDLQKNDGSIDRQQLGRHVFGNPEKLSALEAIVHPLANRMTEEWASAQKGNCVINAALLHKSSIFHRLDHIILVTAPLFTRILRARWRDKLPWREIIRRINSQKGFHTQYLSINSNSVCAEIYRVENPGLSGSRNLKRKHRIDKYLEGIFHI
jgi:dephospho-CoA kinase